MLQLAFRNLFSHPARNAFTALSVTIAMLLVTLVIAAQLQTKTRLDMLKGRNNMLVNGTADSMPLSFKDQIAKVPGVQRVLYMFVVNASSPDKKQKFLLHGTNADYMTIGESWFYVDPDDIAAWEREKTGAIIARQTAQDLDLKVGDRMTFSTELGPVPVTVSAISKKGYKTTGVLVHHEYFAQLFKLEGKADVFWVGLDSGADVKSVGKVVDDMFKNTPTPTLSVSSAAFLKGWAKAGKVIPSLLTGAGLIVLLATLLVTANTIAIGIRERIPELATLRAIGFRRSKILRLLITEVMIICLVGGFLGVAVPMILFRNGVDMSTGQLILGKVELPPSIVGYVLLLSAVLAMVASAFPAWRAARADIANSLRAQA